MAGGCFSPRVDPDLEMSDGSTRGSSTSDGPSSGPTGDPTTDTPTSTDPAGTTASTDPTDNPTTNPTNPTTETTSGGEAPFCGDGNVDPGEECDDGLDNNGLDQGCLPDCNLNVCGDGNLGPDEFCDDGADDNLLEVGACAPDCSTVVEEKVIRLGDAVSDGDLGNNPVATADGTCPVGYRALFAYPGVRRATTSPNEVVDPLDWVLAPWTFYVRTSGELIWSTGSTPLLGLRDGETLPLENSVLALDLSGWDWVLTGLEGDWTTAVSSSCDGWTSTAASVRPGDPLSVQSPSFLRTAGTVSCQGLTSCPGLPTPCMGTTSFYCVEQ